MGGETLEETNKFALYFYAYVGALGLVLLIVTILNYYKTTEFSSNYLLFGSNRFHQLLCCC